MQTQNRLLDDLARVASGAFNTLSGLREEIELRVRERVERMAADLDLVTREEFDAVRTMATKARTAQDELEAKLARLEAELEELKRARAAAKRPKADERSKAGEDKAEEHKADEGEPSEP
jgi:BMFP domain-containing protein YqiC